jgi:cobalamin biosynthesis protein CobT
MLKVGKMGASKKADFSAGSSGQEAGNLNLSGSEESTTSDYNTMDGAHTGEWFDDNHVNNMDGNNIQDVGEGNFNQISPMPGESLSDALCSEPEDEDMKEWMYQQLLAEFDKAVAMEEADVEHKKDQDGDFDGYRSISWQKEEGTLSCVVYREDYRIEVVLTLNGQTRSLVLTDWIYAGELWEMAGET